MPLNHMTRTWETQVRTQVVWATVRALACPTVLLL